MFKGVLMVLEYIRGGQIKTVQPLEPLADLKWIGEWSGFARERRGPIKYDLWVLDLVIKGQVPMTVREDSYLRDANMAHLYAPGTCYWEGPTEVHIKSYYMMFDNVQPGSLGRFIGPSGYARISDPEGLLGNLFSEMLDSYETTGSCLTYRIQGLFLMIMDLVLRARGTREGCYLISSLDSASPFISAVNELLSVNLDSPISMEDAAKRLNISVSTLFHRYKAETGTSPFQVQLKYRLNHAKQLLALGNMNFEEIAERTGFHSASHFSTTFMKKEGLSASEYRKLARCGRLLER
jgi:AraC-like DNA-binding protein